MAESTNLPSKLCPGVCRRFRFFHLVWPVASLLLMASTWRLWLGTDQFPQIPLLGVFVGSSRWIDYLALAVCIGASLLMIGTLGKLALEKSTYTASQIPSRLRMSALIWAVAMLILFFTNQHRLQPWAWQFFVFAILTAICTSKKTVLAAGRAVIVSIYLWSAIGKFDYQFLNGLGRQFASAIADMVGTSIAAEDISPWAVGLLPLGELLVGALLIYSATRKSGVIAAIALHLGLVAILGPWGMGHHAGVVIWNLIFAIITALLFWPHQNEADCKNAKLQHATPLLQHVIAVSFTALVIILPIYSGYDHWLAWGLYSPNNRRCTMKLVAVAKQDVDPALQPYLVQDESNFFGGVDVLKVDLGRMSLNLLDTPIYPEARMQLGVVKWLENHFDLNGRAMVTIESKSDRFSGEREQQTIGPSQSESNAVSFFFNHLPR